MMPTQIKIAPSILAADFTQLGKQIAQVEAAGADQIHIDVMDGHFVPNISFGPVVLKSIRPITNLLLDVHLMISNPDRYLADFADAGADMLTVHVETCPHLHHTIRHIHDLGLRAGVTLNPATPLSTVDEIIPDVNVVLIMSVNPGFGGQTFITRSLDRIRQARAMLTSHKSDADLAVDGGIDPTTAGEVVAAGANVLVSGSAIFGAEDDIGAAIKTLRRAAAGSHQL